ncbi:MAG: class I SAM-dependent methyltransferase [Candidatus Latescibacter sp.]|nr:class I SAM-dependent methyltransferase [Candidatus Latescibacter sp.]
MVLPEDMGHFRRHQEKRRFQCISRLLPKKGVKKVLDAGAGSGWLSEMLAGRGFEVTALDIGLDSILRAGKRLEERSRPVNFTGGDVYRLPFRSGSFDAAFASEILEHLEKPQEALSEIARVVRPGGWIVVSTPYRERIEEILCIHCNKKTPVNAHLHAFDEHTLSDLLKTAGFTPSRLVRFLNRPAERFGMAGFTGFLPYAAWRILDAFICRILGRESFIAVRAERNA